MAIEGNKRIWFSRAGMKNGRPVKNIVMVSYTYNVDIMY